MSGDFGLMAKAEKEGTADKAKLGDFWWDYKTSFDGGEIVFRKHSASYYRKAIKEGKIDGINRTMVERRLASLSLPDIDYSVQSKVASQTRAKRAHTTVAKGPSGLSHRWSFVEGFVDSIGGIPPVKYGTDNARNGSVRLKSGSPLEFPSGTVPLAPFTVQVWASAGHNGLGKNGKDFIFKIASASNSNNDSVFWTWSRNGKEWVSSIGAFGRLEKVGHGKKLADGKRRLYTVTGRMSGGEMVLNFYQDGASVGELKSGRSWNSSPMLILGGSVAPTYYEVRIYSRVLSRSEIATSANEGPDRLPEFGKGK